MGFWCGIMNLKGHQCCPTKSISLCFCFFFLQFLICPILINWHSVLSPYMLISLLDFVRCTSFPPPALDRLRPFALFIWQNADWISHPAFYWMDAQRSCLVFEVSDKLYGFYFRWLLLRHAAIVLGEVFFSLLSLSYLKLSGSRWASNKSDFADETCKKKKKNWSRAAAIGWPSKGVKICVSQPNQVVHAPSSKVIQLIIIRRVSR